MRISVVIPAHNPGPYLREALRSVFAQSVCPHEVIVVDDGSSDESVDRCLRDFAGRFSVIRNSEPGGPSAARNLGWRAASGDWIAFLDADDVWTHWHLSSLAASVAAPGGSGLVFGKVQPFEGAFTHAAAAPDFGARVLESPYQELFIDNPIPQSAVMISMRTLQESGGYDESMRVSEDFDLWVRCIQVTTIVSTNCVSVGRRIHAGQLSVNKSALMYRNAWIVRARILELARMDPGQLPVKLVERIANADLRDAWRGNSREGFRGIWLVARKHVSSRDRLKWSGVYTLAWHFGVAAFAVYDALPSAIIALLRKTRRSRIV
jgi:glycosyltransferase involved in cell wall biosynthesis